MRDTSKISAKLSVRSVRLFFYDVHLHFNSVMGIIPAVSRLANDLVRYFHPRDNLSENSILSVEEGGIGHADEKLRSGTVRMLGPCHGEDPPLMLPIIKFGLDRISGLAHSVF